MFLCSNATKTYPPLHRTAEWGRSERRRPRIAFDIVVRVVVGGLRGCTHAQIAGDKVKIGVLTDLSGAYEAA